MWVNICGTINTVEYCMINSTSVFCNTVCFKPLSSASRTSCSILKVLDWRGAVRDSLFSWIILYTSESLSNLCMANSELELLQEGKIKTYHWLSHSLKSYVELTCSAENVHSWKTCESALTKSRGNEGKGSSWLWDFDLLPWSLDCTPQARGQMASNRIRSTGCSHIPFPEALFLTQKTASRQKQCWQWKLYSVSEIFSNAK